MIITCPSCSARYKVRDELIPETGKKVRCKKCQTVFRSYLDGRNELAEPGKTPAAPKEKTPGMAATVMIDSQRIQQLVKDQQSQTNKKSEPLPQVPENIKIEQKDPVVNKPQPEAAKPDAPEPDEFDSFSAFDDPFESPSEESDPFTSPSDPPDEAAPDNRFGTVQMRVPSDMEPPPDAPQKSASPLHSEFDSLSFDLPESPEKEPEVEPPINEPSGFDFGDELDAEPSTSASFETQAMPAIEPHENDGFPDIERKLPQPSAVSDSNYFQALIEGTPYPKLTLEVLDKWIREGRLLETDQISREGDSAYQRADAFPEVAALFSKYFGDKQASTGSQKKGFFARLFKR